MSRDNYRWIIPSLIALGLVLLSGGIFIGVKSYETLEASNNNFKESTASLNDLIESFIKSSFSVFPLLFFCTNIVENIPNGNPKSKNEAINVTLH